MVAEPPKKGLSDKMTSKMASATQSQKMGTIPGKRKN